MKLYLAGEYYRNMANAVKQIVWGGIVPDVRNESIFSRCDDGRQLAEVSRSLYSECGGTGSIDDTVLGKPSHSAKIQGGAGTGVLAVRGEASTVKIFLAGQVLSLTKNTGGGFDDIVKTHKPFILESFYYADETTEKLLPYFGDFLLDSGAFTFMQSSKTHVVWDEYLERYADFINRNKIEKFFELDIDSVVGYDKVLEYRRRLERLTGRQVIPVWHKSRGIEDYKRTCDEYSYIAIGGIVSKEIVPEQYSVLPSMITEAHRRGAKVHGLGFTALTWLPKCHFDSVDSTAWTTGNRFGYVYQFTGTTIIKHDVPKGKRLADSRKIAEINYLEWLKFQKWAVKNL